MTTTSPTPTTPTNGRKAAAPASATSAHAAIVSLKSNLEARFLEREAEVRGLLVAALAGEHCLLLGPPGTGKSALARAFSDALAGASYFEWLLTRFSTPEELYGPVSLSGLKADRFRRVTAGKLPEAHVAFLDEVFKANSAVLNSLLAVVNERVFHDDGAVRPVPLLTCVAASNEMPEGPELAALWDRFVLRYFVSYTKTEASFTTMLEGSRVAPAIGTIDLSTWAAARAQVDAVTVGRDVLGSMFVLRSALAKAGVEVSDRRWVKAVRLVKAEAWLAGAQVASPYHLGILVSCLWNTPEQIDTVRGEVMKIAGAEVLAAEKAVQAATGLLTSLPADSAKDFVERASAVREELKKALAKLGGIREKVTDPGAQARIDQLIEGVRSEGKALTSRIKTAVGVDF